MATEVHEYTLERGSDRLTVLRDRTRWNFDFTDASFFRDVAQSMRTADLRSLAVFCVHQYPGSLTPERQDALRQKSFQLAEAAHLQIRKFVPDGLNVYAEFARDSHGIQVVSATYGANCGAPAGNATTDFKAQCQDDDACRYVVDVTVLGDPKQGCKKDFQASWTCGRKSEVHNAGLAAEAGFWGKVPISCAASE